MPELIDLIIHLLKDEDNQELSIIYECGGWCVDTVNTTSLRGIGEVGGKYQTYSDSLINALDKMVILLDDRRA
jgi:hypothetical protein